MNLGNTQVGQYRISIEQSDRDVVRKILEADIDIWRKNECLRRIGLIEYCQTIHQHEVQYRQIIVP